MIDAFTLTSMNHRFEIKFFFEPFNLSFPIKNVIEKFDMRLMGILVDRVSK